MKNVIDFNYVYLKNDYFTGGRNTRKRNDFVQVDFDDGSSEIRLYLNNSEEYAVVPDDNVLLNELSHITWTKDGQGIHIKSEADDSNLTEVLQRYNYPVATVGLTQNEGIGLAIKRLKREAFIAANRLANTDNPQGI